MLYDAKGNPIKRDAAPVMQELAAQSRDDLTLGFVDEVLRVQNHQTAGLPQDRPTLAALAKDWQVQATFQQRRAALKSRPWVVDAGKRKGGSTRKIDRMAADWLNELIGSVGWDAIIDKMLWGVYYGYGVAELMYARDGKHVTVDRITVRDSNRFRWGRGGELRLVVPGKPHGEAMPARKFWTFTHGAETDDDPYGTGLSSFLYWPVQFKRQGVRASVIYLERFAHPTPIGTYQPGADKSEVQKLLQSLVALTTSGAIALPEGMSVDKFEGTRSGQDAYGSFNDRMDAAIAKIVLSQTMTTDDGSSMSQANVHMDVAEWVVKGDADLLCGSFNDGGSHLPEGPLEWLTQWNFPGAAVPSFWYSFDEPEDLTQASERDKNLQVAGWRRTQQSMDDTYGEGAYEPIATPSNEPPPKSPPATGDGAELAEANALAPKQRIRQDAAPTMSRWIGAVREAVASSSTFGEAIARIEEIGGQFDADGMESLASAFEDATLARELAGRLDAGTGDAPDASEEV